VKIRILRLILCLALVVLAITTVIVATPAAATTATTSITITRWGANSTILFQETIDYTAMQGNFTVQGNGTTHYWLEGPNYPWSGYNDLWDANETENLKDKGAVKGTDLKDLCMWAGETDGLGNSTDTIKVSAPDGFYTTLPYANVYNPPAVQGPAVICWWTNGDYTGQGAFTQGMRLYFFAQTQNAAGNYVYGDYDMGQTMPAAYQYFNWANATGYPLAAYPSTDGLATKYVSNIDIYTTEVPSWTLQLDGTAIGGANFTVTQQFFAEGIAHHGAATFNDSSWNPPPGNSTYSGMPLWLLCGWVDDAVQHGTGAFNDALAASGYIVKVTDVTGNYSTSLASNDVARSNNFIIANQKNGAALTGSEYPLRLVGAGLSSKGQATKQVAKIQLLPGNTLTMGVSGSGNTTPTVGNHTYVANTQVNISATAASGWQFAGWTGAVGNSSNPNTTVTMDGNKTVTANFTQVIPSPTPTPTSGGNATLNVAANVVPAMIGISLDKASIDFGNVTPCGNSTPVPVGIYNISSPGFGVNVTAQVQGNATAQDFYGQSLYINGAQYNPATIIANISSGSSQSVTTQLRVPCSWNTNGNQAATIIFWASKS